MTRWDEISDEPFDPANHGGRSEASVHASEVAVAAAVVGIALILLWILAASLIQG